MRAYRLTEEEAAKLDAWHIVNAVIFRVSDDAPHISDPDAIDNFFASILSVQAAAYSAWLAEGFARNGGMGHIFECCCAPMILKAIEGYELFGETYAATCLRAACLSFPANAVWRTPTDFLNLCARIEAGLEEAFADVVFQGDFEDRLHENFFDSEKILRENRDCFIIARIVADHER